MDGSIEWEKFHPIEDENDFPNSQDRRCPRCGTPVSGRLNKIYCTANCRKRHREGKQRSSQHGEEARECRTVRPGQETNRDVVSDAATGTIRVYERLDRYSKGITREGGTVYS